jgi:hypothetical protein
MFRKPPKIAPDGQDGGVNGKQNKTSILRRLLSSTSTSINQAANSVRKSVLMGSESIKGSVKSKSAKCQTGETIYKGPKLFWKQHLSAEIFLFYHSTLNFYEVVTINVDKNKEFNRLYISAPTIYSIVEANVITVPKQQIQRRDLIKNARLQCAIDFIIAQLDIDSKGNVCCARFNG